ncbi:hypothetical protein PYW08_003161 [Mythimna loreyi]|uniref:Uncharacterized protein n=1 Tax=Mythimna loreyi TaxID=667449 RepID=A0ACC2QT12_9NEOP|nr:hypothetical protein PYW08_003161 [Mythimna loreyi]
MSIVQILVLAYIIKIINLTLCCMMVQPNKEYFHYFAYGSNLLKKRIHINNPSAVFLGVGRLDNYKLDFVQYYDLWGGAVATIVPSENRHVWGAVWKMKIENLLTLDKQEGVATKQYFAKEVDISGIEAKKIKCRTYQHCVVPPFLKSLTYLPDDRRPSITYKQCIINGAMECRIPDDYVDMLKNIPNNGQHADDDLRKRLDL